MKRIKLTLAILIPVAAVIIILFMNKASRESQVEKQVLDKVNVSVVPAAATTIKDGLVIVGTVQANNDITVLSETQGRTIRVFVKTGDRVSAGSPIAQVDDELKQAAFTTAKVNYEKAKKDLQRVESLYKEKNLSESDLENARLAASAAEAQYIVAKRTLSDTKITAPISGIITDRFINTGSMVAPGTPIAGIVDISTLKVKVNLPESDVFKIRAGESVNLFTDVYPGVQFSGKIETISSKADNAHTYPVEIRLSNSGKNPLKAGMFARVEFFSVGNRTALSVPRTSIISSIRNPQVYVVENNTAKLRDIVVGKQSGNMVEVLSGLKEGESVVVNGQNNLSDNVKVIVN